MKIQVTVTVDIPEDKISVLREIADNAGHSYGDNVDTRTLIKRLLESRITETIAYCREIRDKD